jgi:TRAP-type C4-dicarboxylate transport system permease small subunit
LEDILGDLNNTGYDNLLEFVQGTINLAIAIAALVAVIFLVWAGFQYILSRGQGDKAEEAQRAIIYTLLGLVIAFISPLIIRFVLNNIITVG